MPGMAAGVGEHERFHTFCPEKNRSREDPYGGIMAREEGGPVDLPLDLPSVKNADGVTSYKSR